MRIELTNKGFADPGRVEKSSCVFNRVGVGIESLGQIWVKCPARNYSFGARPVWSVDQGRLKSHALIERRAMKTQYRG